MKINQSGLTLIGVCIGVAVFSFFFLLILASINAVDASLAQNRLMSTRDRILTGVRSLASIPASLRNAMIAADSTGVPVNPELLACAGGNPAGACSSDVQYPLTLYSPVVTFVGGVASSIQAISSPLGGAASNLRFDTFGVPCTTTGPECPFLVFTAFKAMCGPAFRDPLVPVTPAMLIPQAICTIADTIEVIYQVQIDPALLAQRPELAVFASTMMGTIIVPVEFISGNVPIPL